jgi:hypothetical protein
MKPAIQDLKSEVPAMSGFAGVDLLARFGGRILSLGFASDFCVRHVGCKE